MAYSKQKVQFKHFVEVPAANCLIGTAHDANNKIKLYLIVNTNGLIYQRNGINDTWDELDSEHQATIHELVTHALAGGSVPRYSTDSLSALN